MEKIYICIVLPLILLLISCSQEEKSKHIIFQDTYWGMTPDELLKSYNFTKDDIDYEKSEDGITVSIPNMKVLETKSEGVIFQFYKVKENKYGLYGVTVSYLDELDMNLVLQELKKEYGEPSKEHKEYKSNLEDNQFKKITYKESEHEKYFIDSEYLDTQLKEKQKKQLKKIFEKRYHSLENNKNWEDFLSNVPMATIYWTDNFSYPEGVTMQKVKVSKNKLFFSGIGYFTRDKYL